MYYWSSSGNEVERLRVAIYSTLVSCYWCVLARLGCFGALGVFGALSLVYPSRLKSPIPLRSPIITSPYPCSRLHAMTMRFWYLFYFTFFSISFVLLLSFLFKVFFYFVGGIYSWVVKPVIQYLFFSHQESYVCELNLTITVNYGFLSF